MDVAQVVAEKEAAEAALGDLVAAVLENFNRETGMAVDGVRVDLVDVGGPGEDRGRHVVAAVRLAVSL